MCTRLDHIRRAASNNQQWHQTIYLCATDISAANENSAIGAIYNFITNTLSIPRTAFFLCLWWNMVLVVVTWQNTIFHMFSIIIFSREFHRIVYKQRNVDRNWYLCAMRQGSHRWIFCEAHDILLYEWKQCWFHWTLLTKFSNAWNHGHSHIENIHINWKSVWFC